MPDNRSTCAAHTRAPDSDSAAAGVDADVDAAADVVATTDPAAPAGRAGRDWRNTTRTPAPDPTAPDPTAPDPTSGTATEPAAVPAPSPSPRRAGRAGNHSRPERDAGASSAEVRDAGEQDRAGRDTPGDAVADRVWTALLAQPASTPAELATAAGAGRSTVSKLLASWADTGTVTSAAGATPRAARRWTAVAPPAGAAPAAPTPIAEPQPTPGSSPNLPAQGGRVNGAPGGGGTRAFGRPAAPAAARRGRYVRAGAAGDAAPSPAPVPVLGARPARLGSGQLRGLVEEFLAEHPEAYGPVEIGRALRRSSGAVANALERLVDTGSAQRISDHPERYRSADSPDTDDNAADAAAADDATNADAEATNNSEGTGPGNGEGMDDALHQGKVGGPGDEHASAPGADAVDDGDGRDDDVA